MLVLASGPDGLATADPGASEDLPVRVTVAWATPVTKGVAPTSLRVRTLRPASGVRPPDARTLAARARSALVARRLGVPGHLLWAVKGDPWLRRKIRRVAAVVSADRDTDRVLGQVPEILAGRDVVWSADAPAVWAALRSLSQVLDVLDAQRRERIVDGSIEREPVDPELLADLTGTVDPDRARLVPPVLLPVSRAVSTIRWLGPALGLEHAADLVVDVLGHFRWDEAPDAGRSGLSAQLAAAAIWTIPDESQFPPDGELEEVADAALAGADDALAAGEPTLARARLGDAMVLLFHRERHAETLHSPLVADPEGYLRQLYANRTFREVVAGGTRPRVTHRPAEEEEGLRVLVLGGAYGHFHGPVVEALKECSTVRFRRPRSFDRFLTRKAVDPQLLDALAELRGRGPSAAEDDWFVRELSAGLRRALSRRLRRADVVFTDWADRSTVWASHLVPRGCRLVVRIHSLDALHPSFHLVDWSSVDEVIVVSEPLRRLVSAMLTAAGADVPVTVVANLAQLHEADRPKEPEARTTLGMVGWGRRVKDPLWALDLLAREPSWRLVLVGPDLPGRSASARGYLEELHRRLDEPDIRDRVEVIGWTDDVAEHLRRVGVILSTSRRESWHLGLVEGAASGAVPVVRNWPIFAPVGGARSLFPQEWVVETLDEAEARIREVTADEDAWDEARLRAQREALEAFDPGPVAQRYREVVLGPRLPT